LSLEVEGHENTMSAQHCLLLIQSTVKDNKNVAFGLLFRNLGGVQFWFILALFSSKIWKILHWRGLPSFQTSEQFDWAAVGAPCKT